MCCCGVYYGIGENYDQPIKPAQQTAAVQETTFRRYGLAAQVSKIFPFQISGGMARRVLTATAAVGKATLLIAARSA